MDECFPCKCSAMSLCLGMLADAAAAHGYGTSAPQQKNNCLMSSPGPLPFLAYSRSALTNLSARVTASRPLSAGSDRTVVKSSTFEVLEDPASSKEDQNSNSGTSSVKGPARPGRRNRKSTASTKTSFQIAHPPPAIKHRQRFNIRPKVLLQIQQISDAARPRPILDVLPSVVFAPKLARKFPSVFKGKDGLGADDLVVVTSQNYDSPSALNGRSENVSEDDSWATREIVAAICQPKKRGPGTESITEICLNHGTLWEASSLPNGAYEFVSMDEDGRKTVARWVPRPPISRRRSYNGQGNSDASSPEQRKFTFSIINPDSRRHPVIATLSRASIDVSDRYSIPSSNIQENGATPRQRSVAPEGRHAHFDEGEIPILQPTMTETDEQLRSLIVITGIFVAFREGYSPNFQYEKSVVSPSNASNSMSPHKPRSLSMNLGNLGGARAYGPESPRQQSGSRNMPASVNMSPISSPTTPVTNPVRSPPPQRTHSTGAAFLQRANSRRPHSTREAGGTTSPVPATNGSDAGQRSPPHRKSKAAFRKENTTHDVNVPNQDLREQCLPHAGVPERFDSLVTIDSAQRPNSTAGPTAKALRKPGRLNKLFRCVRRSNGAR